MESDLADLVDVPRETLDIELKGWVDLDDKVARAKIACHLAALANHGGGYLVFGFTDKLERADGRPERLDHYNRDQISGIIKKYLTPAFQCDVALVPASDGAIFPVIRVPSHGVSPIAAKADGPSDSKGRPQGIVSGVYYIRKPGPESAPIIGAEEWRPIMRRCVTNDRDALLSEIGGVIAPTAARAQRSATERMEAWHRESAERYEDLTFRAHFLDWPVEIRENHCQLSYLLLGGVNTFTPIALRRVLEEVNVQVRDTVWTGWSMFFPFTREEIATGVHPEREDGTGIDVLETNLLGDGKFDTSLPDFWRYSVDGRATLLRAYREDRPKTVAAMERPAGSWLSPETVIRETAELVTHARLMAERFGATAAAFRCTWTGLAGRHIDDFSGYYWSPGRTAKASHRTTQGEWPVAMLAGGWDAVVADLACPVLSLFGLECGPELVSGLASRFRKL